MSIFISDKFDIWNRFCIIADSGTSVSDLPISYQGIDFLPGSKAKILGDKNYILTPNKTWEADATSGGGASSWNDLTEKPFERIGTGLEVDDDGALNVPATSAAWGNITGNIEDQTDLSTILNETVKTSAQTFTNAKKAQARTNIGSASGVEVEEIKDIIGYYNNSSVGIEVDYENKIFTRLGAAVEKTAGTDFDAFPMFGGRKRCNVANDGTINAYYGDTGYTEDGTNGQVMVYQPAFYYKVVPIKLEENKESNLGHHIRKAQYYVRNSPKIGFKLHPAFYDGNGKPVEYILLSAYEGAMWDASKNKYVNDNIDTSVAYAAGDLLCSVAGKKPISGLRDGMGTRAKYEAMANNRGAGWHLETVKALAANQLLMIIEIGMMNTQTGIDLGIESIIDNSSYNCCSLTGSTGSLGNGTGSAASTINEKGGVETTETESGKVSITYRGVENPWGNCWKHIQGINIWGDGTMAGGQPFICDDLSSFDESSHTGHYHGAGFTLPNANGHIKAMGYGNPDFDWLLMPSEIGGDSSLPVGDYCAVTANLNSSRIALFGGTWDGGINVGGFYFNCGNNSNYRRRSLGGRLLYVPTAQ